VRESRVEWSKMIKSSFIMIIALYMKNSIYTRERVCCVARVKRHLYTSIRNDAVEKEEEEES
jgi:hypothetical protein